MAWTQSVHECIPKQERGNEWKAVLSMTMTSVMPDDAAGDLTGRTVLERMLDLAEAICQEIEGFDPDLVVALYHSGQAPLRAALALWRQTRHGPFPPVVRTNLGREKVRRYDELRAELGWSPLVSWVDSERRLAHCLAWIDEQHAWREELGNQVAEVLGEGVTPDRILVIDDFLYEGTTWVLALGLLHSLFPAAESRFMSGALDGWRGTLAEMWLDKHHRGVYKALEAKAQAARHKNVFPSCGTYLGRIVAGTEDVDGESLAWQPITARSEVTKSLSRFLPAKIWRELPVWAYRTIEVYVRQRAAEAPRLSAAWREGADPQRQIEHRRLSPAHLVLKEAWLHKPVTCSSVAALCRMSPSEATGLLNRLVADRVLLEDGREQDTHYTLQPKEAT
jgi:hypothetical protein